MWYHFTALLSPLTPSFRPRCREKREPYVREVLSECVFQHGHSLSRTPKPIGLWETGKAFLRSPGMSVYDERSACAMISNCSFFLLDVYSLRLLIYRDLMPD